METAAPTENEPTKFPRFSETECALWFFHWLRYRFVECPSGDTESCTFCLCVRDNVQFATGLMIESLYDTCHSFTSGSDIVPINMSRMTKAKARRILATYERVVFSLQSSGGGGGSGGGDEGGSSSDRKQRKRRKYAEICRYRLEESLARDFPGVAVSGLSEHAGVYAPLMGPGGNSLYHTLSILYKATMRGFLPVADAATASSLSSSDAVSNAAVVDFCLLCFHLNGQYFLTANSIVGLWSDALHLNSVSTLVYDEQLLDSLDSVSTLLYDDDSHCSSTPGDKSVRPSREPESQTDIDDDTDDDWTSLLSPLGDYSVPNDPLHSLSLFDELFPEETGRQHQS